MGHPIAAIVLLALSLGGAASGHRLDEYLQATLIGLAPRSTEVEIRLTPGVATLPLWMAVVDQDRDGHISPAEQRVYAARVVRDVELRVDGVPAPLSLIESEFPTLEAMRRGLGTIRMKLRAARGGHRLRFENRHLPQVSVYLVNCLADTSDALVVSGQQRDGMQRSLEFEYSFDGASQAPAAAWIALVRYWPAALAIVLAVRMALLLYRAKHTKSRPGQPLRAAHINPSRS